MHPASQQVFSRLSKVDQARMMLASEEAAALEIMWQVRIQRYVREQTEDAIDHLERTGELPNFNDFDLEPLLVEHMFDVWRAALYLAETDKERWIVPTSEPVRLKRPKSWLPKSMRDLLELWDKWKNKQLKTPYQKRKARDIKAEYLKKVHKAWKRSAQGFLTGDSYDQAKARERIREASQKSTAYANTVVETETTRYYNSARRKVYDRSDDVVAYLFLAIRDHATTKWCLTRTGLVYLKGSAYLERETPPCFTPETRVLTLTGWKRIDTIGTADYVWTHEQRWRRVTKIHRTRKELVELLQIGHALATPNHPYFERGIGFVEAELFRPEKGIRAGALNLRTLLKAGLDAMVQARPKILLHSLSHHFAGRYSKRAELAELERWKEETQARLHWNPVAGSSTSEQAGLCSGACSRNGTDSGEAPSSRGDRPSLQRGQNRQPTGKLEGYVHLGTREASPKSRTLAKEETVYNLDVEEDHTYYAGGYLVHNCHWNCRSEILPLTLQNPTQRKLIEDKSLRREGRRCEPLPKGWNSR